ncbi:MAG: hypothetical protein JWR07_1481 [Nevskia sp.]|nr:hypothetical protein [Nevskia sp.]
MSKRSDRLAVIKTTVIHAVWFAVLPMAVMLAGCNAPPPPPAAAPTVIERTVVERPSVVLDIHAHDDDQRRREDEQRRHDEEQRQHDQHDRDQRPH